MKDNFDVVCKYRNADGNCQCQEKKYRCYKHNPKNCPFWKFNIKLEDVKTYEHVGK